MDISIIIPSKDRNHILFETLQKAYVAISGIDGEIILVNDSKTQSIPLKPEWTDIVKVIDNPKSGVASARNLGAKHALSELLIFMDDDMWITKENILTTNWLLKTYNQNCCINLNWVYPPELQNKIKKTQLGRYLAYYGFDSLKGWCRGITWYDDNIFPVAGITSQYLAISKSDFSRSGGYNENFPHAGAEDHDFSIRLKKSNIQPYIYPMSLMYHNEADRMDLKSWLARKRRGGETRRVAVQLGYKELEYNYGFLKSMIYNFLIPIQSNIYSFLSLIPNYRLFDPIFFKTVNLMLGTALYEGYYRGKDEL